MIQALVERLPAVVCPRWVATLTQPIATGDVLTYLAAALDLSEGSGGVFEIGGPEVVSYGDMMREYARLRGLHRVPVPVRTPHLSGLWLAPVTPAQARVGRGRHDSGACAVGDAIDGWTVEAYERDHRLRPSADLELPGRGWLEFEVTPLDGGRRSRIRQTATFDLRGVLGRLYWYAVQPIHRLMFRGMLDRITRRAHAA